MPSIIGRSNPRPAGGLKFESGAFMIARSNPRPDGELKFDAVPLKTGVAKIVCHSEPRRATATRFRMTRLKDWRVDRANGWG